MRCVAFKEKDFEKLRANFAPGLSPDRPVEDIFECLVARAVCSYFGASRLSCSPLAVAPKTPGRPSGLRGHKVGTGRRSQTGWKQLRISEPIYEALRATGEVIASEPTGLALCVSLLARKPLRGPTAWATKPPKWALEAHFIKQADALEAAERKRIYDSSDFDTLDGDLTGVFFS